MKASQQVAWLEIAGTLVSAFEQAEVELVAGGLAGRGIPRTCVKVVTAYLERHRGIGDLRNFVALMPQLDGRTAQNVNTPKAYYHALRQVLERAFDQHPTLDGTAWLYVLSWAGRLLRSEDDAVPQVEPEPQRAPEPQPLSSSRRPRAPASGLGVMAHALRGLHADSGSGRARWKKEK